MAVVKMFFYTEPLSIVIGLISSRKMFYTHIVCRFFGENIDSECTIELLIQKKLPIKILPLIVKITMKCPKFCLGVSETTLFTVMALSPLLLFHFQI